MSDIYHRIVESISKRDEQVMRQEARAGIRQAVREGERDNRDYARDCAVDHIEKHCFGSEDWQTVKATDITDIACEIASEVEFDDWMVREGI
jgi:hypothetical protein